jgi:predicted transcriptional regulator
MLEHIDRGMPEDQLSENEDGRRHYPESQFIEAIEEGDTSITTTDVAQHVGCSSQAALYRLNNMEDEDVVTSELIGNTLVWSLND